MRMLKEFDILVCWTITENALITWYIWKRSYCNDRTHWHFSGPRSDFGHL